MTWSSAAYTTSSGRSKAQVLGSGEHVIVMSGTQLFGEVALGQEYEDA